MSDNPLFNNGSQDNPDPYSTLNVSPSNLTSEVNTHIEDKGQTLQIPSSENSLQLADNPSLTKDLTNTKPSENTTITPPPNIDLRYCSSIRLTDGRDYITDVYKYIHLPGCQMRSQRPEKDMLLSQRQAAEKIRRLPKGYTIVPIDPSSDFQTNFEEATTSGINNDNSSVASGGGASQSGVTTTSRSNRNVRAPAGKAYNDEHVVLDDLMRKCLSILSSLMTSKAAYVFNEPVDPELHGAPNYFDIVKYPMDLGTVQLKLKGGEYGDIHDFAEDVRLTFNNAMTYNPPDNWVHELAKKLLGVFNEKYHNLEDFAINGSRRSSSSKNKKRPVRDDDDDDNDVDESYPKEKMLKAMQMMEGGNSGDNNNNMMMNMMSMMMNMMMMNQPSKPKVSSPPPPSPKRMKKVHHPPPMSTPRPVRTTKPSAIRAAEPTPITGSIPTPAPMAKPMHHVRMENTERPSAEAIKSLEDKLTYLTEDQVSEFLHLFNQLNPHSAVDGSGEIELDFGDVEPSKFQTLQDLVDKMISMNNRPMAGQPTILVSPDMYRTGGHTPSHTTFVDDSDSDSDSE